MKKRMLAAVAMLALAAPAQARDGTPYVGIEGGIMVPRDAHFDEYVGGDWRRFAEGEQTIGLDADVILGYDWGFLRTEVELGHKRAGHDEYRFVGPTAGGSPVTLDADGNTRVNSTMLNILADFGEEDGTSFIAGAGVGWSWTKYNVESANGAVDAQYRDRDMSWQILVGLRRAISPSLDVGAKYRYFSAGPLYDDGLGFESQSRFKSHSLLASLIFNFGGMAPPPPPPMAPPPPPPMAPPPPQTQTCADGSVIAADAVCPAPPPPPPPMAEPERG